MSVDVGRRRGGRRGRGGGARGDGGGALLPAGTRRSVTGLDPRHGQRAGEGGRRRRRGDGRPDGGLGLRLEPGAADEVVALPVLVLAEGAAVARGVAAAARLAGLAAAVPATLGRGGAPGSPSVPHTP